MGEDAYTRLLRRAAWDGNITDETLEREISAHPEAGIRSSWAYGNPSPALVRERVQKESTNYIAHLLARKAEESELLTLINRGFAAETLRAVLRDETLDEQQLTVYLDAAHQKMGKAVKHAYRKAQVAKKLGRAASPELTRKLIERSHVSQLPYLVPRAWETGNTDLMLKRINTLDPNSPTVKQLLTSFLANSEPKERPALTQKFINKLPKSGQVSFIEALSWWVHPEKFPQYRQSAYARYPGRLTKTSFATNVEKLTFTEIFEFYVNSQEVAPPELTQWVKAQKAITAEEAENLLSLLEEHVSVKRLPYGVSRAVLQTVPLIFEKLTPEDAQNIITRRPNFRNDWAAAIIRNDPDSTVNELLPAQDMLERHPNPQMLLLRIRDELGSDMNAFNTLAKNFTGSFKELITISKELGKDT